MRKRHAPYRRIVEHPVEGGLDDHEGRGRRRVYLRETRLRRQQLGREDDPGGEPHRQRRRPTSRPRRARRERHAARVRPSSRRAASWFQPWRRQASSMRSARSWSAAPRDGFSEATASRISDAPEGPGSAPPEQRVLEHAAQLAHVAAPGEPSEQLEGAASERGRRLLAPSARHRRAARRRAPGGPRVRSRRDGRRITAPRIRNQRSSRKPPPLHQGFEVAVRRRHHADVGAPHGAAAHRPHLAGLERAQQLHLHGGRRVADLVEEERAAARRLEEARRARAPRR